MEELLVEKTKKLFASLDENEKTLLQEKVDRLFEEYLFFEKKEKNPDSKSDYSMTRNLDPHFIGKLLNEFETRNVSLKELSQKIPGLIEALEELEINK